MSQIWESVTPGWASSMGHSDTVYGTRNPLIMGLWAISVPLRRLG